jgi:hypothetical protein
MMHSWEAPDPNSFRSDGAIASAFLRLGKQTFRSPVDILRLLRMGGIRIPAIP